MKQIFLIAASTLFFSFNLYAQTTKNYNIELYNKTSVKKALTDLSRAESDFWTARLALDSTMESRIYYSTYSTYSQMVELMKQLNYKMEKNILEQAYSFKVRRDRFMKTFLSEKQFAEYEKIIAATSVQELASYNDTPTKEIQGLRNVAAGWNVLGHTITYSE